MSATYSIKIGTPYEAKRIVDIEDVLKQLPDNTNKEISPKDVRDAFLSTWSNSPFKTTTLNGVEYIGIDSGNPSDRDIKQKILLGKRQYKGSDILNGLLSYDTDIYFYNTKSDSTGITQSTKISILSGTNSNLFAYAPYIESQSNGLRTDLIIRNPSTYSNINIESKTGRVSINGISFPTIDETKSGSSNGKILRYQGTFPNGSLKWSNNNIDNLNIGTSTTETKINGATVSLNGFDLEFYDTRLVPKKIGGVEAGMSFSKYSTTKTKWPLSEVLRKLLYTYVAPELKLSVYNISTGNSYYEPNTSVNIGITYSATIYSIGLFSNNYINPISGAVITKDSKISTNIIHHNSLISPSASQPGYNKTGFRNYTQPAFTTIKNYYFYVNDSNGASSSLPTGFTHSATASMYPIWPIYYGFTSSVITTISGMTSSLSKIISPSPVTNSSIYIDYKGSGYLYFCFPKKTYDLKDINILSGTPSKISDAQLYGFNYYDSKNVSLSIFTYSVILSNSIGDGQYSLWRTINKCSYTELNKIEFKF
jgi:hypothetical protein